MWDAIERIGNMIGNLATWGDKFVEEEVIITSANTDMTKHLFKDPEFVAEFKTTKKETLMKRLKMNTKDNNSDFNFDAVVPAVVAKATKPKSRTPRPKATEK